jgi:CheY-like chemotaxis protein
MPKSVLLVDDNPSVRHIMKEAFESSGFSVSEAEDGAKAIGHVRNLKPDLIVLDLAMPAMNGLQAAPTLRQLLPTVPIILFTMYEGSALEKEAKAAGITCVMSKDIAITKLLNQANQLLHTAA